MHLTPDGAQHLASALNAANLAQLERVLGRIPVDRPGMRLSGNATLAQLPSPAGPIGRRATAVFKIVRLVLMVSAWTAIPLHWAL